MLKERFFSSAWIMFTELLPKGYRLEIKGEENLVTLNSCPDTATVLYFNHTTTDDLLIMVYLIGKYLPNRLKNVIFPVSEEYLKLTGGKPEYIFGVKLVQYAGFNMLPIVQSYRLRDERLSEEKRRTLEEKSSRLARKYVQELKTKIPHGALIVIAPEGHRSPDGKLLPAEEGLGFTAKLMVKNGTGVLMPVGLWFEDSWKKGLNYNPLSPKTLHINIGMPISAQEIIREAEQVVEMPTPSHLSHCLMIKLRDLLPEKMWGYYHPDLFPETSAGRFVLGINSSGKVEVLDSSQK